MKQLFTLLLVVFAAVVSSKAANPSYADLPIITVSPIAGRSQFSPSTPGTTTCGIREAIAAAQTAAAASTISNGPPGGAVVQFQAGTYSCSGQILFSNRFPNPIILQGVQSGPSPGTIIKYTGTTNCFQTTAPSGLGITSLLLRNMTWTSAAVTTNRLFKLTDVYQLRGDSCLFCGWGLFTNPASGTMSGFIGSVPPAQAAGLVAFETGDGSDYTSGVVEFNDCRFWGCVGMATTTDHQFVTDCSFALNGGQNKTFTPNLWPVGTSYHYPESCYAQSPGWINNSTGGDVLFRGRWSVFNTRVAYIGCKTSLLGSPTFIVDSDAQLESAAYLVLQYDDAADQQINLYAPSSSTARSGCSTIKKPGTITGILPSNLRFHGHGTESLGETNLIYFDKVQAQNNNNTTFFTSLPGGSSGTTTLLDLGDVGGRIISRGTNYFDALRAGVSVDISRCTVSGGTDSGINGVYVVKGRINANGSTSFGWTNAAFVLLQADGLSGYGGIYAASDTIFAHELYYNNVPVQLGPDYYVAAAGQYDVNEGVGTPPTVTFPLTTNSSYFRGNVVIDPLRQFIGDGNSLTNIRGDSIKTAYSTGLTAVTNVSGQVTITANAVSGLISTNIVLTSDATSTTTTPASLGLNCPVGNGSTYVFDCYLYFANSVPADGITVDFVGGPTASSVFRAQAVTFTAAAISASTQLAARTDTATAAPTGNSCMEIHGTANFGTTGNFSPRISVTTHTVGTLTVYKGSSIFFREVP